MTNTNNFKIPTHYVAVGASAGGLEAIESFFKYMAPDSGLAFIVIQHLSPDYKSLMVELLSKHTQMKVLRAEDNMFVQANCVYLIPPKKNMTIFHGKLILSDQEQNRGINLPIDIFLKSLAEDQGEKSISIILSGTGSDGMRGIRPIKEHGGMVMVQREDTAKFDGMPKNAISTGMPDFILAPEDMPDKLISFIKYPNLTKKDDLDKEEDLTRIFALLRDKTGVDFTYYKPSTVLRRIERRMTVNQLMSLRDYTSYMQKTPREVTNLFRELLIGVTNFFRDRDAFDELDNTVIKTIIKNSAGDEDEEIRVWVAGCSTGEEAYSIAISFLENMEKLKIKKRLKIFATDVDADAILYAGNGTYPENIIVDIPANLLAKYFVKKDNSYTISRTVRELVVFAQQNIIKDPPFTKMDLISCRNLLIYLQPVLQKKVLEMFSFSLNTGGFLFLGASETTGDLSSCFELMHPKWKIFCAKNKREHLYPQRDLLISGSPVRLASVRAEMASNSVKFYEAERLYERLLDQIAEDYIKVVIVVNEQFELIHSVGNASALLKVPSGRMTNDVTKLVNQELSIPLATGLQKCLKTKEEVRYSNITIPDYEHDEPLRLRIKMLPMKKGKEPLFGIFLEKSSASKEDCGKESVISYDIGKEAEVRIHDLESELQITKESLQATIEELETSNEELQATNEELLASNEELQSTNEELQSVNEELYTVNSEYQNKITELTELNNDLDNLLSSTQIGTLFLDEEMKIRKFTPLVTTVFRIIDGDIGRSLQDINHNIADLDIYDFVMDFKDSRDVVEKEIRTKDGNWFLMRIVPYFIAPKTYSGLTITFIGINDLKSVQTKLKDSMEMYDSVINSAPVAIGVVFDGVISKTNKVLGDILGYELDELTDQHERMLYSDDEEYERVVELCCDGVNGGDSVTETSWVTSSGEKINVILEFGLINSANDRSGIVFSATALPNLAKVCRQLLPAENCLLQQKYGDVH